MKASSMNLSRPAPDIGLVHSHRCILAMLAFLYALDTTIAADLQLAITKVYERSRNLARLMLDFHSDTFQLLLLANRVVCSRSSQNTSSRSLVSRLGGTLHWAAPTTNVSTVGRVVAGKLRRTSWSLILHLSASQRRVRYHSSQLCST